MFRPRLEQRRAVPFDDTDEWAVAAALQILTLGEEMRGRRRQRPRETARVQLDVSLGRLISASNRLAGERAAAQLGEVRMRAAVLRLLTTLAGELDARGYLRGEENNPALAVRYALNVKRDRRFYTYPIRTGMLARFTERLMGAENEERDDYYAAMSRRHFIASSITFSVILVGVDQEGRRVRRVHLGGFFRGIYTGDFPGLSRYGLFQSFRTEKYKENCLVQALRHAGIPKDTLAVVKSTIGQRYVRKRSLHAVADAIGREILVRFDTWSVKDGAIQRSQSRVSEYKPSTPTFTPPVKLGLVGSHFFIEEPSGATVRALMDEHRAKAYCADTIPKKWYEVAKWLYPPSPAHPAGRRKEKKDGGSSSFEIMRFVNAQLQLRAQLTPSEVAARLERFESFDSPLPRVSSTGIVPLAVRDMSTAELMRIPARTETRHFTIPAAKVPPPLPTHKNYLQFDLEEHKKQRRIRVMANAVNLASIPEEVINAVDRSDVVSLVADFPKTPEDALRAYLADTRGLVAPGQTPVTPLVVYYDFETFVNSNDVQVPYLLAAFSSVTGMRTFYGKDCGEQMLAVYEKLDLPFIRLVAHNAAFDSRFLLASLTNIKMISRGSRLVSMTASKGKLRLTFVCSLMLFNRSLADCAKMFSLETQKEIMPHSTMDERLWKGGIYSWEELKKDPVFKTGSKEERFERRLQFRVNATKWVCMRDGAVNMCKYSAEYCRRDVMVLREAYEIFRKETIQQENVDLVSDHVLTAAQLSLLITRISGALDDVEALHGAPRLFITQAARGGRTMLANNRKSRSEVPVADLDVNSLYPFAQKELCRLLGGYLKGSPVLLSEGQLCPSFLFSVSGFFVRIQIDADVQANPLPFPTCSVPKEDGTLHWTNDLGGADLVVDRVTLEDLLDFQGVPIDKITFVEGYYFNQGRNDKIQLMVDPLYARRQIAKKDENKVLDFFCKLLLNSGFGNMMQRDHPYESKVMDSPEELERLIQRSVELVEHYTAVYGCEKSVVKMANAVFNHANYVHVAVEILSMSKRVMNRAFALMKTPLYSDTDSVFIPESEVSALSAAYKKVTGQEMIVKGVIGRWASDFEVGGQTNVRGVKFIGVGKKIYAVRLVGVDKAGVERQSITFRCKGIPHSSVRYAAKALFGDRFPDEPDEQVWALYERLYAGDAVEFDLLEGKNKIRMVFRDDMAIECAEKFTRTVQVPAVKRARSHTAPAPLAKRRRT